MAIIITIAPATSGLKMTSQKRVYPTAEEGPDLRWGNCDDICRKMIPLDRQVLLLAGITLAIVLAVGAMEWLRPIDPLEAKLAEFKVGMQTAEVHAIMRRGLHRIQTQVRPCLVR